MHSKTKPESSRVIIARNIAALRKHRGWSQAVLGRKAGVGQRTISNMEDPKVETTPTTDRVEAVARVFGLELYQITMPLPLELLVSIGGMARLIDAYAHADQSLRPLIEQVASIAVFQNRSVANTQNPPHLTDNHCDSYRECA